MKNYQDLKERKKKKRVKRLLKSEIKLLKVEMMHWPDSVVQKVLMKKPTYFRN